MLASYFYIFYYFLFYHNFLKQGGWGIDCTKFNTKIKNEYKYYIIHHNIIKYYSKRCYWWTFSIFSLLVLCVVVFLFSIQLQPTEPVLILQTRINTVQFYWTQTAAAKCRDTQLNPIWPTFSCVSSRWACHPATD